MPNRPAISKRKEVKRTIKFLATCKDPSICRSIVAKAPRKAIEAISNASLNAYKGDVQIPAKLKKQFAENRAIFEKLISRDTPVETKRDAIVYQKGGAFLGLLAPLLGTVLGSIGSAFLSRSSDG
jgi:hypothetical protein